MCLTYLHVESEICIHIFQLYVWMAAAGSLVFCAVIINVFKQFATFIKYSNDGGSMDSHLDHRESSLWESAWLMVCLYTIQGKAIIGW